jgi:hypothetical protein
MTFWVVEKYDIMVLMKGQWVVFRHMWRKKKTHLGQWHILDVLMSLVQQQTCMMFPRVNVASSNGMEDVDATVTTPLWGKCEDLKSGNLESSRTPATSELDNRAITPHLEVLFISLKRPWSVDVENGLAWAIWTSIAQVIVERRVGSQTANLTLDHKKSGIDPIPVCADGVRHTVGKLLRRATSLLQTSFRS